MVLATHISVGYLNKSNAKSCACGHHHLLKNVPHPPNNDTIHKIAKIIKAVMSSATEVGLGVLYINGHKVVEII